MTGNSVVSSMLLAWAVKTLSKAVPLVADDNPHGFRPYPLRSRQKTNCAKFSVSLCGISVFLRVTVLITRRYAEERREPQRYYRIFFSDNPLFFALKPLVLLFGITMNELSAKIFHFFCFFVTFSENFRIT